jgi:hypothetical protein
LYLCAAHKYISLGVCIYALRINTFLLGFVFMRCA